MSHTVRESLRAFVGATPRNVKGAQACSPVYYHSVRRRQGSRKAMTAMGSDELIWQKDQPTLMGGYLWPLFLTGV